MVKPELKLWREVSQIFFKALVECFPTFFCSRHPYLIFQVFGGTLAGLIGIKIVELLQLATPLSPVHGCATVPRLGTTALVVRPLSSETPLKIYTPTKSNRLRNSEPSLYFFLF